MPNSSNHPANRKTLLGKGFGSVIAGKISLRKATLEAFRRGRAIVQARRERSLLDDLASQPARLRREFQELSSSDLLKHFRERTAPSFFPGFEESTFAAHRQRERFPTGTDHLLESARKITKEHCWPLLGFAAQNFGPEINWHRDPLSGRIWPLAYHADIPLWHDDGSDIRVLWELNRLGHFITLGRAYALTGDEEFAGEFFLQLESWREQNPVGRGANWSCAMEVALRSINLLAVFRLVRRSPQLNEARLSMLLTMFDQHGAHIRRNLEFSHVTTSNHYLSDVAGLLWLGIMLPELGPAEAWREWALAEMLRELDKQVLADGADYEGSTGYHCFVLELFLYSFLLCRTNGMMIDEKHWLKLHAMLDYLRVILRPDGFIPLIGDTDGSQLLPVAARAANDRAYLLAAGAVAFKDSRLKLQGMETPPELLWLSGEAGVNTYEQLAYSNADASSQGFPDAGSYALRHEDLYLLFNANAGQTGRPTSHRHNDLLSIEVSACGRPFIIDPGSYVYTADLQERHLFRSTSYHSTLEIDELEQTTIRTEAPFVSGGEARVRVLLWERNSRHDRLVAEHTGYERLAEAVTHRRGVTLHKLDRWWLVEDEIIGKGEHTVVARFHFAAGLEVRLAGERGVVVRDEASAAQLCVLPVTAGGVGQPVLESQFVSSHYGAKLPSTTASWTTSVMAPCKLRWAIVPVRALENLEKRMTLDFGPWTLD